MKIVLTGATGFIGSYLTERLLADGHEVIALVRHSTDIKKIHGKVRTHVLSTGQNAATDIITFLNEEKPNGIVHLASRFLVQHIAADIQDLVDSNVLFPTTLLEAAVQAKVPWFINTGTFWQHFEDKTYSPVNLYAATKQAFQDMAQFYVENGLINFVTLKLFNVFGPNDTRQKVFTSWNKMTETGEELDMTPGEQIIDITYIDNVIDAYVRLIELVNADTGKKMNGHSYATSSPERMPLRKLAAFFESVTGKKLKINWGKKDYRPRDVMVPWTKGEPVPGWKPKVGLKEGIERTLKINAKQ